MVRDGSPNPEVGGPPGPRQEDVSGQTLSPPGSLALCLPQPERLPWRRIARSLDSAWEMALGARTRAPLP